MRTDDLIQALRQDAARQPLPMGRSWWLAVIAGALVGAIVFAVFLHPRADMGQVMHSGRFLLKFAVSGALAVTALIALRVLSRPEGRLAPLALLLAAPLLLAAAVAMELLAVPSGEWRERLIGHNSMACLAFIPALGIVPLVFFVIALRHGAPTHPTLAGATAGLLSGGIAAFLYAAHCVDDSPLFVATWYTIGTLGLSLSGALAGKAFLRW